MYTRLLFVYFANLILMWKTVDKSCHFSTGLWKSLWNALKSSKISGIFHQFFHNFCGNGLSRDFAKKVYFLLFSQKTLTNKRAVPRAASERRRETAVMLCFLASNLFVHAFVFVVKTVIGAGMIAPCKEALHFVLVQIANADVGI